MRFGDIEEVLRSSSLGEVINNRYSHRFIRYDSWTEPQLVTYIFDPLAPISNSIDIVKQNPGN